MSLEILILVITCVLNLALGMFILLRNTRLLSNVTFFLLTLSISAWAVSNFLTEADIPLEFNQIFNRLAYLFGFLCMVAIVVFCYNFPTRVSVSRKAVALFTGASIITLVLSVTPLVAGEVTRDDQGLHFSIGPLLWLYALNFLSFLFIGVVRLLKTRRNSSRQTKSQIMLVLLGFVISVMLGLAMNVIMPAIFANFQTAKFGPLLTVVLVGMTTYAIVKHGMFSIKLVIARSIAYLALVASFALIYSVGVFGIAYSFVSEDSLWAKEIIPISVALFLVFTGPYLKRFFDKKTNQIFYRDAYEPQFFLDELNDTLVANIEIGILVRHTAMIIKENIKAECRVYLRETESNKARTIGTTKEVIDDDEFQTIKHELATFSNRTIVVDELEEHYSQLKKTLEKNNIAIVSSMTNSYEGNKEPMAYLLLGPKKSGNTYSRQDVRIIDIISDELLIAIQNALRFEEIQAFNITLQKRINDATAKLRRSNEKLKEMDETKDEFISMASHQLRTPLTSVKGYLSMVLDGDAGKITPNQKELLNQAFVSSQRMVYLIADLLNVSRLKTGKFIIEKVPTNLAEMVESEIAQLKEVAKSRKLILDFDKPKDFPELLIDETKTRQVVMNFVDNAIYYTPAGGHIKIELKTDKHSVYFMVKDNGMGVPKEDQTHLFTKFYRAKNAQKARPDGTGLGLFMAKKVINEQGGSILFESAEGKGSTFGFKFDRPKDDYQPQA